MKLSAGDRPLMIVERVWHPVKDRAFRVVTCRQGDSRVRALGAFAVKPDDLIVLARIGWFWTVAGVLK